MRRKWDKRNERMLQQRGARREGKQTKQKKARGGRDKTGGNDDGLQRLRSFHSITEAIAAAEEEHERHEQGLKHLDSKET